LPAVCKLQLAPENPYNPWFHSSGCARRYFAIRRERFKVRVFVCAKKIKRKCGFVLAFFLFIFFNVPGL
jgi:hypothetical protein